MGIYERKSSLLRGCFFYQNISPGEDLNLGKRLIRRLSVIALWLILSLGIYQCSIRNVITEEKTETEDIQTEKKKEVLPMDNRIRVLIKTSDYADIYHEKLVIRGTGGLYIERDKKLSEVAADMRFTLTMQDLQEESIIIRPKSGGRIILENVARKESVLYRGIMECFGTKQGLVLVNELTVEEYLYGVVPSEMPMSYPVEALKAQAVSARTYAYYHKRTYAYPMWCAHVDDSTAYQVYQNISENDKVTEAVDATKGLVMTCQDELIESFYYATSCGYSAGYEAWSEDETRSYLLAKELTIPDNLTFVDNVEKEKMKNSKDYDMDYEKSFQLFIDSKGQNDIEKEEPWYRWQYVKHISTAEFLGRILKLSYSNSDRILINSPYLPAEQLSKESAIHMIEVAKRASSGMVTQLTIRTEHFTVEIHSQHCIREVLAKAGDIIRKQDGTEYVMGELLPSAFFYVESIYEDNGVIQVVLHGGGMGHGAGMSQNGAKCLANMRYTAEEILRYFYQGIEVKMITYAH